MQDFFTFGEITERTNPREVGHRALLLGDLYNAGFPVQKGFVISSQLLKEFIIDSGIRERLFTWLRAGHADKVIDLLLSKKSKAVEEKIVNAYKEQGFKEGFLQSSSVFKDHKFLVRGVKREEVMQGVRACWASLFRKRADILNSKNLFSAVVAQTNLNIKKSGFLYTEYTGKSMLLEVVKPKKYFIRIDKESYEADMGKNESPLTEAEIKDVAKLGKNIEAHYRVGSKVHWVLSNRLYCTGFRELRKEDYSENQAASSLLKSSSTIS